VAEVILATVAGPVDQAPFLAVGVVPVDTPVPAVVEALQIKVLVLILGPVPMELV
jgi:hypothetical protein